MKIITLVTLWFWILENDDVTCNPRLREDAAFCFVINLAAIGLARFIIYSWFIFLLGYVGYQTQTSVP